MKVVISLFLVGILILFKDQPPSEYSLKVEAHDLRNAKGVVRYILYDSEENFPDKDLKTYYKIGEAKILNHQSSFTFYHIPKGEYAIHILHDENQNGKTDMGLIKPKEGIGFSNYNKIGLTNRPKFSRAKFMLNKSDTIYIKTIYL